MKRLPCMQLLHAMRLVHHPLYSRRLIMMGGAALHATCVCSMRLVHHPSVLMRAYKDGRGCPACNSVCSAETGTNDMMLLWVYLFLTLSASLVILCLFSVVKYYSLVIVFMIVCRRTRMRSCGVCLPLRAMATELPSRSSKLMLPSRVY